MFTIVKDLDFALVTPAYMELSISNVLIRIGLSIESKPFVPFCIDPNGDMTRFGVISNGGFWLLVCRLVLFL